MYMYLPLDGLEAYECALADMHGVVNVVSPKTLH